MPENECFANASTPVPEEEWMPKILTYLIAILAAWFICFLLTVTDLEPEGGEARTDKNHTMSVLARSPWFQVPYPGQFGFPKASLGLTLGFVASCVACTMESIGDYQTCARVSTYQGVGSALAAIMGLGTGVTTYAENIALMHITRKL
ncbi:hypothetical protein ANCCEY_07409 [Ancylostoma ceylanicum]|uniref:Uncharacterized protein n=1 Tax=Ancylostoma ceylanicum TaxID=53326 RepID=A0A0D6LN39_9BILA|nr:hypothetical protein ANCCEY_07409 [Ancylostoma ceylanicum]